MTAKMRWRRRTTTPPPPPTLAFANITESEVLDTSARVSWDVTPGAQGEIRYGTTSGGPYTETTERELGYLTFHSQDIPGLTGGTTYYYVIWGMSAAGVEGTSAEGSFETTGAPVVISASFYGPGIAGDTLANTRTGSAVTACFFRFKAEQSSPLLSFIWYYLAADSPSYGSGTGGTIRVELKAVDGNGFPTGSALATQNLPAQAAGDADRVTSFSSPYTTTAGIIYALVITNTDANPSANNFSTDCWTDHTSGLPGGPDFDATHYSPRFLKTDFGHGYLQGSTWQEREHYLPVLSIAYANGQHQGMSYGEASYNPTTQVGRIEGGSYMVRERFVVTGGSRTVTGVGIRLLRLSSSGTGALTITLRNSSDVVLATATIAAASIATGSAPNGQQDSIGLGYNQRWVAANFGSPVTMLNGQEYRLRFSCPAGTTYYAWVMRRLTTSGYAYATVTAFTDGYAEKTTDGTNWSGLGRVAGYNDLQFYLPDA
jgi:hypothetical protein